MKIELSEDEVLQLEDILKEVLDFGELSKDEILTIRNVIAEIDKAIEQEKE